VSEELLSVDQVAERLGLHVRTVRGYVRDGRLKAVRIGKQYRIARADLAALTGAPAPVPTRESTGRRRRVEVTGVVQVDAVAPEDAARLANLVNAMAATPRGGGPLHLQTVYDEERASMKIIVVAGPADCAEVLRVLGALLEGDA
jgi:excisionase family DNA binding protein